MKVALAFPGCHRRGGVERIMQECALFLAGRGHDVQVFAHEWDDASTPERPIRYRHVPALRRPWFLYGASYFRACSRLVADATWDVLNTHGCVCPLGGVPWVQSVHRSWLERSQNMRPGLSLSRWKQNFNPLHPILLHLETLHFRERNYRKVIVTTNDVKNDLHRIYSVPKDDIIIIPNGFSPEEFSLEKKITRRNSVRSSIGIQPNDIVLLFVANELERKGYRTLLKSLTHLQNPNIKLLVVGKPDQREVISQAEALGVARQVIPCGPTADVASFHAAADMFVLPTQYEAFCLAILEALGSGLPVITSNIPGAYDAIDPGNNGFLIDSPQNDVQLSECIERLCDPVTRERMSEFAPLSVRQHQWPVLLERYEDVLTDCLAP